MPRPTLWPRRAATGEKWLGYFSFGTSGFGRSGFVKSGSGSPKL
jgi:hypothetical protein